MGGSRELSYGRGVMSVVGQRSRTEWTDPWSKTCRGRGRALTMRDVEEALAAEDLYDDMGEWCDGYYDCDCSECYEKPPWLYIKSELGPVIDLDEIRRRRAVAALADDGS